MRRIGILLGTFLILSACSSIKGQSKDKDSKAIEPYLKGYNAYRARDFEKAHEYADKAIKKDPKYVSSYSLKAAMYDESKDLANATIYYEKAVKIDDNPKYYYFLSAMHFRYGEYEKAAEYGSKAVSHKDFNSMKTKTKAATKKTLSKANFAKVLKSKPVAFNPVNMGPKINTKDNEYFPGISIDKKYFFFTKLINRQEDLYRSTLDTTTNSWNTALSLGREINSNSNEGTVSPTIDGRYIFFTKCNVPGGVGRCDIYFSKISNGIWSKPMVIKPPLNTRDWESQPSITADGKTLYFSSDRQPSFGGMDIFKSEFKNGAFQAPVNLGPKINSPGNEQASFIHTDGKTLYFVSDYHPGLGNNDIFVARLNNDTWDTPTNLGYPINTQNNEQGIVVDRTGGLAYYTSDREGGFGGLDLYTFNLPKEARPFSSSYVEGLVTDINTREKLASSIELVDLSTGKITANVKTTKGNGEFLIALPGGRDYLLNVNNEAYLFYSDNFSLTSNTSSTEPYFLDIRLSKPSVGEKVVLKNIFFDVDKFDIKTESSAELDKLVELLKRFKALKIEIGGHTDSDGNDASNLALSTSRAKSVMNYLISKGIDKSRLSFKGYGETKPIASNETKDGKSKNRRTEFKVISN